MRGMHNKLSIGTERLYTLEHWRAVIMHVARGQRKTVLPSRPTITIQLLFLHKTPLSSPRLLVSIDRFADRVLTLAFDEPPPIEPNRSRFIDDNKKARATESGSMGTEGRSRPDRSAKLKIKRFAATAARIFEQQRISRALSFFFVPALISFLFF